MSGTVKKIRRQRELILKAGGKIPSAKLRYISKYPTRMVNRCRICGRKRSYIRQFDMCRICFREHASKGTIPGINQASW